MMEIEVLEFGVRLYSTTETPNGGQNVGVHYFIMPNLSAFSFQGYGDGYGVNWHVPIDDTVHWVYRIQFSRDTPLDHEAIRRSRLSPSDPVRNRANRYQQDREQMKAESFAGLGTSFPDQDACVTEGAGPIQDRTQEHLASTDKCLVAERLMLLRAIRALQQGQDPPLITRDPIDNSPIRLSTMSVHREPAGAPS